VHEIIWSSVTGTVGFVGGHYMPHYRQKVLLNTRFTKSFANEKSYAVIMDIFSPSLFISKAYAWSLFYFLIADMKKF